MTIAKSRAKWRSRIKASGAYSQAEYAKRISVHRATLEKYLGQFGRWLGVWTARNERNRKLAQVAFTQDGLEAILAGDKHPKVAEVLTLSELEDFGQDFRQYFLGKTHLSYELKPSKPRPRNQDQNTQNGPYYSKLGEFIYIILAEYIVLHNYQFVSKKKDKGVNTIDRWMKEIR